MTDFLSAIVLAAMFVAIWQRRRLRKTTEQTDQEKELAMIHCQTASDDLLAGANWHSGIGKVA
jgi:hypothetical protein